MLHIIQRAWVITCQKIKNKARSLMTYLMRQHSPSRDWSFVAQAQKDRLCWYGEYWVERLGRKGLLTVCLILLLLSYATLIAWPNQLALLQQVTNQKIHLAMLKPTGKLQAKQDDAYHKGLRKRLESRKWPVVAQLLQAGLVVHEASYVKEVVVIGKLQRLNMELVLSGSYPSLIQALTNLRADPLLRLEFLQLERSGPETSMAQIRIRLSTLGMI
ncbi:hypothetical protein [Aeromonas jandaei]|uniref:hypothetical protein n=1 Tax=Aeromonas jandaei TaxID=650 RepID=UPI001ABF3CD7|nr:hypothetical protein [Aeromonas jandaei]QSR71966.1 hypothetical protein GP488_05755 [Aeromonas jandaei]